jgi:hypothetical protein
MKIKDQVFEKFFNLYNDKVNCIKIDIANGDCDRNKISVENNLRELYQLQEKPVPHISWMTLDDVRDEFFDDDIEIITSMGNVDWVIFYEMFLDFIKDEEIHVTPELMSIYENDLIKAEILYTIMSCIFGFIELDDEIILVEKVEKLYEIDNNNKLHSVLGPTIQIKDFREYFIHGDNVTPKAWSKRLRIALVNPEDTLLDGVCLDDTLTKIQEEIYLIDGDDIMNINEPMIFAFYLDRSIFSSPEIIGHFSESVNTVFMQKHFNAIAFFFPTDDEERIECINPKLVDEEEYQQVRKTLEECQKLFDIKGKA